MLPAYASERGSGYGESHTVSFTKKLRRAYPLCGYETSSLRFMPSESNLSSNEARNDASTASCVFWQLNDLSGQCPRFERTIVTFLVAPVDRRVI